MHPAMNQNYESSEQNVAAHEDGEVIIGDNQQVEMFEEDVEQQWIDLKLRLRKNIWITFSLKLL